MLMVLIILQYGLCMNYKYELQLNFYKGKGLDCILMHSPFKDLKGLATILLPVASVAIFMVMTAPAMTKHSVIHSNMTVFAHFWYKFDRSHLSLDDSLEAGFWSWLTMAASLLIIHFYSSLLW